ncbi:MAG TPA: tetratricopeptide repeat protein [Coleofasciculaceae cyanobacterium]
MSFQVGRSIHQGNWGRGCRAIVVAIALLCCGLPALAEEPSDALPPSPLEITEPDPLLPAMVVDRPLSDPEKAVLTTALDELQRQGLAKLESGDLPGALLIWNRELRLRRFLGTAEEVKALSRVGDVAWRQSETTEVRVITARLLEIQQQVQAQTPVDYDLLLKIAQAYQTMRARTPAVALYDQLLTEARQQQNRALEQQILTALAEMQLAYFDYPNASAAYEQLLVMAREQGNRPNEELYLKQLAYIYQQNSQPTQAVAMQQQLVDLYRQQQNFLPIPLLKIDMGDSYVAMGRPDLAAPSYQEAFATARSVQQYAQASDALERLATLYRSLNRPEDAIVVYQLLLDVQQQSYNMLGRLNTYDQMGQIYRATGNMNQAIAAFRQALQIAQQLNYKVAYFTTQIEQAAQPAPAQSPQTPAPAP